MDITPWHKAVRVMVEVAARDRGDDPADPAGWSGIEDWDAASLMHLGCVKRARDAGARVPYDGAVSRLLLDEIEDRFAGVTLALIDGGLC
jgi:hypothetical protein